MKWEGYELFYCEACDDENAVVEFCDYYGAPPDTLIIYHVLGACGEASSDGCIRDIDEDIPF